MKRINLDHWFVSDNSLSISLMRFYVNIDISNTDGFGYQLKVLTSGTNSLTLDFSTLEEAVFFTENVINKCNNASEIVSNYGKLYGTDNINFPINDNKMALTPEDVDKAIVDYYESIQPLKVTTKKELTLDNGKLSIAFYVFEHFNNNNSYIKIHLEEEDIWNVLEHYTELCGYDLVNYNFLGGIHRTGYFFAEDTPHFDGIELTVKKREIAKVRK